MKTHHLDRVTSNVPHHLYLLLLAQTYGPTDGLGFLQWVPLGLEEVDTGSNGQC